MRRPPQLGQKRRPLHENGASRSSTQSAHQRRAKPCASTPQVRKAYSGWPVTGPRWSRRGCTATSWCSRRA